MGRRIIGLGVIVVILALGVFMGSALSQRWAIPEATAVGVLPARVFHGRVRVEVLNGAGLDGLARSATDVLRDDGFDVVFYGNARDFDRDSSVVMDRIGKLEMARAVADALGIPRVISQPDTNLYLDVTVVLGEDWQNPAPVGGAARDSVPPWWHYRRWLPERDTAAVPSEGPLADPGESR